jgi:hypothetical protein
MAARTSYWVLGAWLTLACVSARAQQKIDFDGSGGSAVSADADGDSIWERLKKLNPWSKPAPPAPQPVAPAPAPAAVVRIVSWNLQTFGKHINPGRKRASEKAMEAVFKDPQTKLLAAQEIADDEAADVVQGELPSEGRWTRSFENSSDPQDNGFFARDGVQLECSAFLFADRGKSRHPARAAHVRIGALDFTIITVHLAYDHGHADHAFDELRHVLDWIRAYEARPGADPDVVIAGDFNLPTRAGKAASQRAHDAQWKPIDDVINEYADLQLVPLVDQPTSRQNGEAANNYDHFVISKHLADTAFVVGSAGRMPEDGLKAIEASEGAQISDHFPISAQVRSGGAGNDGRPIQLDGQHACPL